MASQRKLPVGVLLLTLRPIRGFLLQLEGPFQFLPYRLCHMSELIPAYPPIRRLFYGFGGSRRTPCFGLLSLAPKGYPGLLLAIPMLVFNYIKRCFVNISFKCRAVSKRLKPLGFSPAPPNKKLRAPL